MKIWNNMLNFLSCLYLKETVLVTHLCPTLWDSMDCSPGSSVHGILQARILQWVAISFSRGSSQSRDRTQTQVSRTAGGFVTIWATRQAQSASEPSANCNHFAGRGSCLDVHACWQIGGSCWRLAWLWQFLKIRRQWNVALSFLFMNDLSVVCSSVW